MLIVIKLNVIQLKAIKLNGMMLNCHHAECLGATLGPLHGCLPKILTADDKPKKVNFNTAFSM